MTQHLPAHPFLTHPRTGEPLRAIGFTRRGPVWPQLGASPDDPPAGDPPTDTPNDPKPPAGDPPADDDKLGDPGKKALAEERRARKAAEADLAKYRKAEQEQADANKSEAEKRAAAEQRSAEAEMRATRVEVAFEKGLTLAQAKRLVGSTREELEADADEIKRDFPAVVAPTPVPTPKPDPSQGPRPGQSGASVSSGAALYAERHKTKTPVT